MPLDLTPDQLKNIQALGISLDTPHSKKHVPLAIPLLSISGLSLLSIGGLVLLKSNIPSAPIPVSRIQNQVSPSPTQVPKSIQHYLLTSQQYFTQAIGEQKQDTVGTVSLINQSILTASSAIKEFPSDYRGYEQRGRIYQSLLDSQPQLLSSALKDFSTAYELNPSSAEITRALASLSARSGDAASTEKYLSAAINLDPTQAQNFYDLAKLQQQIGHLPQALSTYDKLLSLVSDPAQKTQISSEATALKNLITQNPLASNSPITPTPNDIKPTLSLPDAPSLIQASAGTGLIIGAPETKKEIFINSQTQSNSLSGNATLPANTKSISLQNDNLTPDSQVYLTVVSGGKNLTLQVLSRSGKTFLVGLDTPTTEPIVFKWWIVK